MHNVQGDFANIFKLNVYVFTTTFQKSFRTFRDSDFSHRYFREVLLYVFFKLPTKVKISDDHAHDKTNYPFSLINQRKIFELFYF